MNKILLAALLLTLHANSFAGGPAWEWAKTATGAKTEICNTAYTYANGDVLVAGSFASPYLVFGTDTLNKSSATSSKRDAFLAKYSSNGNLLWAKQSGNYGGNVFFEELAIDASGNIYVSGWFTDTTYILGTDTLPVNGTSEMFLAKFDGNGNPVWAKSAKGNNNEVAISITLDLTGNPIITGYFSSDTLNFGATLLVNDTTAGFNDIFLAKYNSNGGLMWAKKAGGTGVDFATDITRDEAGNIYMTGEYNSRVITFGTFSLNRNTQIGNDIFIAKYDASGNVLWLNGTGGSDVDASRSIAVDKYGNAYITAGFRSDTIIFGADTMYDASTNATSTDMFIAKYNTNGNPVWAKNISGTGVESGYEICTNTAGDIYVAGTYNSPNIYLGNDTLTHRGLGDFFVVKYDSSGNVLWQKNAGSAGVDGIGGLSINSFGNLSICGNFYGTGIALGADSLINSGSSYADIYVARLTDSLPLQCAIDVSFTHIADSVCDNTGVTFTNNSTNSVSYTWMLDNAFVSNAVDLNLPSPSLGYHTVMLIASNSICSDTASFSFSIISCTAINEVNEQSVNLYPNPAASLIFIETNGIKAEQVNIYNTTGCLVIATNPIQSNYLNISSLATGVYIVEIITRYGSTKKRWVKM